MNVSKPILVGTSFYTVDSIEEARAEQWLKENPPNPAAFAAEFKTAKAITDRPLGSSTITGH